MKNYDHREIESAWQKRWDDAHLFEVDNTPSTREKAYILDMFPYPSGAGLHVGHLLNYTGSDILARFERMRGKDVLHPMGWDAFGLPAENYAVKTNVHPAISTEKNTLEYKRQFKQVGTSYDWTKEINTSSPEYYRWTQWCFAFLYKKGLAYRKDGLVNWCPKDQTVLANEQVVGGKCDRCGSEVVQRSLRQWYFKITDYADRLIADLDDLDWPEKIKSMQRNWIGRSEGAALWFAIDGSEEKVEVFTTRADTLFGATYLVVAPEHPLVTILTSDIQEAAVAAYIEETSRKTELERTFTDREKTGVFTGAYAINPATGEKIPVWVADYVLSNYGTGAIMAVPAHDERDYAFAQKFNLPIVRVLGDDSDELPLTSKGVLSNSGVYTGKDSEAAMKDIVASVGGERRVTYRIRDWLVSRQRFWGAPIPIAYDEEGAEYLVPDSELPITLPMNVDFSPTGKSPLVSALEWKQYRPDGENGPTLTRETDTLDGFVCSSWYFLRFPTPHDDTQPFDQTALKKWFPVDTYIGGAEHAVMHLLYARFLTKVFFDAKLVPFHEPFKTLKNQGMILGPDHNKMSKSKGNVINPDDVIAEFGADSLRAYEMFMGPFDQEKPWNTTGIVGVRRFMEKVWKLQEKVGSTKAGPDELRAIHFATKKVTEDIQGCRFNTAVSTLMELVNTLSQQETIQKDTFATLLKLLSPIAPHITEELWSLIGQDGFCSVAAWPTYDEAYLVVSEVSYPVQINGKVRANITVSSTATEDEVRAAAEANPTIQSYLKDQEIRKVVVIPGKIISYALNS